MKLLASLTILGLVMAQSVTAQTNYTKDPESCTSIMVGKKAHLFFVFPKCALHFYVNYAQFLNFYAAFFLSSKLGLFIFIHKRYNI